MKALMKSQIYQIFHSKIIWITFGIILFIQWSQMNGEIDYSGSYTVGKYIVDYGFDIFIWSMIFCIVVTAFIVGGDFADKTSNYEILSGHTRKEIFFSRAILSLIVSVVGFALIVLIVFCFASVSMEFGNELKAQELLIRFLLSLLVALRVSAEFICITYLVQNQYLSIIIGVLSSLALSSFMGMLGNPSSVFLGITSFNRLSQFESWETYTMGNTEKMIYIYGQTIQISDILEISLASIMIAILALVLGYSFFKRDDIR